MYKYENIKNYRFAYIQPTKRTMNSLQFFELITGNSVTMPESIL